MKNREKLEILIPMSLLWKIALVFLAIFFVFLIRDILIFLFLAFIGVSAAQPLVNKLESKKIPRSMSASLIFLLIGAVLFGIISAIVPVFIFEIKDFSQNSTIYLEKINTLFPVPADSLENSKMFFNGEKLVQGLSEKIAESFGGIFSNALSFFQNILSIAVVFSLAFYMLVKKNGVQGFLKNIIPKKNRDYIFDLVVRIQNQMGRWLLGQLSLVLAIFCLDYVALYFLNVPYALVLAFFGGIMEIIPYVGPILAVIPAVLVGLTISPLTALLVVILYVVIQQLENHIIVPLVMKKAVGLDPVVIILSLLIGATLFGFLGILAAVPMAAALNIFLGDFLENKEQENSIIEKNNQNEMGDFQS